MYTLEDLKTQPYMNIQKPASRVSGKYSFIPTSDLVDRCLAVGLTPVSYTKIPDNKRDLDRPMYGPHVVRLRTDSLIKAKVGDLLPEITIQNSANGLSSLKVNGGLYRLACSNGLTIPVAGKTSQLLARHKNIDNEWVNKVLQSAIDTAVAGGVEAQAWGEVQLNSTMEDAYIKSILDNAEISSRFYNKTEWTGQDIINMMFRNRDEDRGNDLWTTMNVIQEKVIRGGFQIEKDSGKTRQVKPLNNLARQIRVNQAIWTETQNFTQSLNV